MSHISRLSAHGNGRSCAQSRHIAHLHGTALAGCAFPRRASRITPMNSASGANGSTVRMPSRLQPGLHCQMSATASSSTRTRPRSAPTRSRRLTVRLSGLPSTRTTRSLSKAMPTNVVRREYNLALGARRANATRDYLVSRGVPASRMKTHLLRQGTSGSRPATDISCWSQNRRAVTVLGGAGM